MKLFSQVKIEFRFIAGRLAARIHTSINECRLEFNYIKYFSVLPFLLPCHRVKNVLQTVYAQVTIYESNVDVSLWIYLT